MKPIPQLTFTPGMSLGEFQEMIAARAKQQPRPKLAPRRCQHPFDASGLEWRATRRGGDTIVAVRFRCQRCDFGVVGEATKRIGR